MYHTRLFTNYGHSPGQKNSCWWIFLSHSITSSIPILCIKPYFQWHRIDLYVVPHFWCLIFDLKKKKQLQTFMLFFWETSNWFSLFLYWLPLLFEEEMHKCLSSVHSQMQCYLACMSTVPQPFNPFITSQRSAIFLQASYFPEISVSLLGFF